MIFIFFDIQWKHSKTSMSFLQRTPEHLEWHIKRRQMKFVNFVQLPTISRDIKRVQGERRYIFWCHVNIVICHIVFFRFFFVFTNLFINFIPCKMRKMHFGCWGHYLHFSASKIGLLWVTWNHFRRFRPNVVVEKRRFLCRRSISKISSSSSRQVFAMSFTCHSGPKFGFLLLCILGQGCSIWSSRVPGDPIRLVSQLNQILHVRGELLTYECFEPFTVGCFFLCFLFQKSDSRLFLCCFHFAEVKMEQCKA